MYKVIGTRKARTFRILWMLEEMGEAYTHDPSLPRSEAVLAINPTGRVPVLLDGDHMIPDSMAIMTYLGDRHGKLTYPAGTPERARQDAFTFDVLAEIDARLWCVAQHSFILPEDQRVPAIKASMKAGYERHLTRMSETLEGPFLMGDDLTIPDLLLGHCLSWAKVAGFPAPDERMQSYGDRLVARSAFQRVMGLP